MIHMFMVFPSWNTLLFFIIDSTVKGTFVLSLAMLTVLLLRRDSAASRHHVLATAIVLLLLIPLLSHIVPPSTTFSRWVASVTKITSTTRPLRNDPVRRPAKDGVGSQERTKSNRFDSELDSGIENEMEREMVHRLPPSDMINEERPAEFETMRVGMTDGIGHSKASWNSAKSALVVLVWSVGCGLMLLRSSASVMVLKNSERSCQRLFADSSKSTQSVKRDNDAELDRLRASMESAANRLQLVRPVQLLLDPSPSIPVVWGILRPRLRLPRQSLSWTSEQQLSVCLHELSHVSRNDLFILAMTQLAWALHWFNPLVWIVAWRLHWERERACDDMVLDAGVRSSGYARHLVEIVGQFPAESRFHSCGLALARRSTLELRLRAVLNQRLNRRVRSRCFAIFVFMLGMALAIPVAMVHATTDEPDQPKATDRSRGTSVRDIPAIATQPHPTLEATTLKPQHETAQTLFAKWQARARTDGKIPGALVGRLAREIDRFIAQQPNSDETQRLALLRPRLDSSRDWPQKEVVELLDTITTITTAPMSWTELPMRFDEFHLVSKGQPLPPELKNAKWGRPAENGLQAAWLFRPNAEQYAIGTVLSVRVLFYNSGPKPIVFRTETWHQNDQHRALDANDREVKTTSTRYTGITPLANYLLLPGEYGEVSAPGVGIGAGEYQEEFSTGQIGTILEAQVGDEISLSHTVDVAEGIRFSRPDEPTDPVALWKNIVADRLMSDGPLPKSTADRELLLRRAMLDLTGFPPTPDEVAHFVNDSGVDALENVIARIQAQEYTPPWTGKLPTGETKFRVLPADPEAAKKLRSAIAPGRYVLAEGIHLIVKQTTSVGQGENQATIVFLASDPQLISPHKPFEISLPDGSDSYAFIWSRGSGQLVLVERGAVRRFDYSNLGSVKETRGKENLGPEYRDLLPQGLLAVKPSTSSTNSVATVVHPTIEAQWDWGEVVNGLRGAIVIRSPQPGEPQGIFMAIQNVSALPLRFVDTVKANDLRKLYVSDSKTILFALTNNEPTQIDVVLQPREVAFLSMMLADQRGDNAIAAQFIEGIRKDSLQTWRGVLEIKHSPPDAWKGRLSTGETRGAVGEHDPQPNHPKAQALYKVWQNSARLNGDIPGGLLRLLHDKVTEFIRNNRGDQYGDGYAQKMAALEPRFGNLRDWTPIEVVILLDDIAEASAIPLETTWEHLKQYTLQRGMRLPTSFKKAAWGEPLNGGLRMAYRFEPSANEYHLGSQLKGRILLYNSGPQAIAFVTTSFQQPRHTARLVAGEALQLDATDWMTRGRMEAYRLAPGEFCEIMTPGLGIGQPIPNYDDWSNAHVGSWIRCQAGDNVLFSPGAVQLSYSHLDKETEDWWLDFIIERLERESPVPREAKEREYLIYRVVRDLFGSAPLTTEGEAFAADQSAEALKNLAVTLSKRAYLIPCRGEIQGGASTFQVLPPDARVDEHIRVVTDSGWYTLTESLRFSVNRYPREERIAYEASVIYFSQGQENVSHPVKLPAGYGTWAAAWTKGASEFWIAESGRLRQVDFANPLSVQEKAYEGNQSDEAPIPAAIREALRRAIVESTEPTDPARPPSSAVEKTQE